MNRKAVKPFTLSNGMTIPPGSTVSTHLYAVHKDPDNYPNPLEFEGYRFLNVNPGYTGGDGNVMASRAILDGKMDEQAKGGDSKETKEMWYTTSKTFLGFGHGKHGWYVTLVHLDSFSRGYQSCV
jgi:cytochrome P450